MKLRGHTTEEKREYVEKRINSLSGINENGFNEKGSRIYFDKKIVVGGSHTFSKGMLKLKDTKKKDVQEESNTETKNINAPLVIENVKHRYMSTTRNTSTNASRANLLESQPPSSVDRHNISPITNNNSKTILHQAYLQALKQSTSMQELQRYDNMPINILNRSDAELARTRQDFLDQYDMVNQYTKAGPSYKFTLSTDLVSQVE